MKKYSSTKTIYTLISLAVILFASFLVVTEFLTRTNYVLETFSLDYVDTFAVASLLFFGNIFCTKKRF